MGAVYLKDTSVIRDANDGNTLCDVINVFGGDDENMPYADASTIPHFSVEYALTCVNTALGAAIAATPLKPIAVKMRVSSVARLKELQFRLMNVIDANGDEHVEATSDAMDAFWKVIADRFRPHGYVSGDLSPGTTLKFRDACTEVVGDWLSENRPATHDAKRPSQRTDQASEAPAKQGSDESEAAEESWNRDRDFQAFVESAHTELPKGWRVRYEYPGYFSFRHEAREDFAIIATPDYHEDGFIPIDGMDDAGKDRNLDIADIPWPIADRVAIRKKDGMAAVARAYLWLMRPVLEKFTPKKLVVEYDVTGWTDAQIAALSVDAAEQAEKSDDEEHPHPFATLLSNEVVP